ncbi:MULTISPECIES: hypothetical protein [unclassified Modestobacter]
MNFGIVLMIVGGFLLGGAYSIFKADSDTDGRTGVQMGFAGLLLLAAVLATAAGVLRLV